MARPSKNNCDYFPHFTTMRNHKKVKALRTKFGSILGYAFWSMFIEYLTEQDGNEFENSEIEMEMFAGELGVSVTEIQEMINYCIKIELLFLTEDNFIYSDSLNEYLRPVFDKRQKAKEFSKTRKRHKNGSFCDNNIQTDGISVTEMPQSKVNKSKVNKSKVNKTLLSEIEISDVPEEMKQYYTIAISFQKIIQIYLEKLKIKSTAKHTYGTWINAIRLMFESDKRTIEEFREVAEYLKNEIPDRNGFSWQANIRSADTLRRHFEEVLIKLRQIKLVKKEVGNYRKITETNLMGI
jgi:hypothetical protein